jgi:hypothetical protein
MVRMIPEFSLSAVPCEWRSQHTSLFCNLIKTLRAWKLYKETIFPFPPKKDITDQFSFAIRHFTWLAPLSNNGRIAHPYTVLCLCNCVYLSLDIVTLTVLHLWRAPSVIWRTWNKRIKQLPCFFLCLWICSPPTLSKKGYLGDGIASICLWLMSHWLFYSTFVRGSFCYLENMQQLHCFLDVFEYGASRPYWPFYIWDGLLLLSRKHATREIQKIMVFVVVEICPPPPLLPLSAKQPRWLAPIPVEGRGIIYIIVANRGWGVFYFFQCYIVYNMPNTAIPINKWELFHMKTYVQYCKTNMYMVICLAAKTLFLVNAKPDLWWGCTKSVSPLYIQC